ncbi:MAG TPA: GNAT family N-acetyltransferase [Burkholderiales bacterium]|nr:GNAT family N-acetyltransferase [Burkholderiales bacterium]
MRSPATPAEWAEAKRLVKEYAASLDVDLCFQDFGQELDHFEEVYGPPQGRFFLESGKGCAGLRRFAEAVGEMKRLYVVPAARGQGIGEALARAVIDAARVIGYRRVVLDTLPDMKAAQKLYRSLGFRDIAAYRHNPVEGTLFFELQL